MRAREEQAQRRLEDQPGEMGEAAKIKVLAVPITRLRKKVQKVLFYLMALPPTPFMVLPLKKNLRLPFKGRLSQNNVHYRVSFSVTISGKLKFRLLIKKKFSGLAFIFVG